MLGSDSRGGTEEHGQHWCQESERRNPARTWGKRSWNSARAQLSPAKRRGTDTPNNTSQGVPREGKRADVSKILSRVSPGEKKRQLKPPSPPQAQATPSPRERRRSLIATRDILTEHRRERLEGNGKTNLQSTGLVVTKEKDLKKSHAC